MSGEILIHPTNRNINRDLEGVLNVLFNVDTKQANIRDHLFGKYHMRNRLRKKLVERKINLICPQSQAYQNTYNNESLPEKD